ncbi:MAG: hypothetical protein FWG89_05770 [Treponema sp.]|nr:hypothetical protein [Treponema sp.]
MKNLTKSFGVIVLLTLFLFGMSYCSRSDRVSNSAANITGTQATAIMAATNTGNADGLSGTWVSDDTDTVYTMVISGDRITVTWSGDTPWSGNTWTGRITDFEFEPTPDLNYWNGMVVNNNGTEVGAIARMNYIGDDVLPVWIYASDVVHFGIFDSEVIIAGTFLTGVEEEVYSVTLPASRRGDVYAAGWLVGESGAVLWINGVAYHLTGDDLYGRADSVFVSDSDVYVAGQARGYSSGAGNWSSAVLWKNGVMQYLPGGTDAHSVYVSGGDVYVAGYNRDHSGDSAVLWINGIAQHLAVTDGATYGYAQARSVFVSGSNMYVAGSIDGYAVLWTNGVAQYLTSSNGYNWLGHGTSVFVSSGDVYVTGSSNSSAIFWKNGEVQFSQTQLQMWEAGPEAHSVFVSGGNVYVAGRNQYYNPVLWVNGVEQRLPGGTVPRSVFVSGGDVYVAGGSLLKNGVAQYDFEGQGVNSIFVVE